MTTPRPDLLPEGATLVTWALTPELYMERSPDWRQWGPGPWDSEPDRIEWRSPGSSLPRLALRNNFGAWCGYVGVPEGHRAFGKDYDDAEVDNIRVHGGLTYGRECAGNICHVPREGEPDHVWWLGFDCNHAWDLAPGLRMRQPEAFAPIEGFPDVYRDVAFIIMQCEMLAAQLEAKGPNDDKP